MSEEEQTYCLHISSHYSKQVFEDVKFCAYASLSLCSTVPKPISESSSEKSDMGSNGEIHQLTWTEKRK